ncbi:MAG TPA: hypothetical protein VIM59_14590 [Cellvibrio sp.]
MDFKFLGKILSDDRRVELRKSLIEKSTKYFYEDRSDSIPISCRFIPSELSKELEQSWFNEKERYVVYMENYEVMVLSKADDFVKFLNNREPWQDYDACIFDENLTFCIAITHNDEIKIINY